MPRQHQVWESQEYLQWVRVGKLGNQTIMLLYWFANTEPCSIPPSNRWTLNKECSHIASASSHSNVGNPCDKVYSLISCYYLTGKRTYSENSPQDKNWTIVNKYVYCPCTCRTGWGRGMSHMKWNNGAQWVTLATGTCFAHYSISCATFCIPTRYFVSFSVSQ